MVGQWRRERGHRRFAPRGAGAWAALAVADADLIHYTVGASEKDEEEAIRKAVDFSTTARRTTVDWSGLPCEAHFWDWKLGPAKGRVEAGCCQPAPLSEPYLKVSLHTAKAAPTGAPYAGTRRQPSDVRNDFGLPGEGRGHWGVRTSAEHAPCKASALREVFGVA